jgi:hypothetical protein
VFECGCEYVNRTLPVDGTENILMRINAIPSTQH